MSTVLEPEQNFFDAWHEAAGVAKSVFPELKIESISPALSYEGEHAHRQDLLIFFPEVRRPLIEVVRELERTGRQNVDPLQQSGEDN